MRGILAQAARETNGSWSNVNARCSNIALPQMGDSESVAAANIEYATLHDVALHAIGCGRLAQWVVNIEKVRLGVMPGVL